MYERDNKRKHNTRKVKKSTEAGSKMQSTDLSREKLALLTRKDLVATSKRHGQKASGTSIQLIEALLLLGDNTAIEAGFDQTMQISELSKNFIVARGIGKNYSANPKVVNTININGSTRAIDISGSYAYITTANGGLVIVDISNVSSAQVVGKLNIPATRFHDVKIVGNLAYLVADSKGFFIADISDPTKPKQIGHYNPSSVRYRGLAIQKSLAYVVNYNKGLQTIDISSSTNPILYKQSNSLTGNYKDIYIDGPLAFLTAGQQGVDVYDISNPSNVKKSSALSGSQGDNFTSAFVHKVV